VIRFGRYETFLADNPGSLLLRILGAHCLRSYSSVFYFFVMENLFNIEDDDDNEDEIDSADGSPSSPKSAEAQTDVNAGNDSSFKREADVKIAIEPQGASDNDDESDDDDDDSQKSTNVKVRVIISQLQETLD